MKSVPIDTIQRTASSSRPHIIILGAGASLQAFPDGDASGRRLPLMDNIIEILGLESIFDASPASFYNDSSLNKAVRNKELSQTIILPQGTKLQKKMSSGEYEEIKGIQNISMANSYPTDFYVYCMAKVYQHRFFDDFDTDACLLIYDSEIFLDKFLNCLKTSYSDWLLHQGMLGA